MNDLDTCPWSATPQVPTWRDTRATWRSTTFVTADEVYGHNATFRTWLTQRGVPFVLAPRSADMLTCPNGYRHQAKSLAALVEDRAWERRSAGPGAHGQRVYDWTVVAWTQTS